MQECFIRIIFSLLFMTWTSLCTCDTTLIIKTILNPDYVFGLLMKQNPLHKNTIIMLVQSLVIFPTVDEARSYHNQQNIFGTMKKSNPQNTRCGLPILVSSILELKMHPCWNMRTFENNAKLTQLPAATITCTFWFFSTTVSWQNNPRKLETSTLKVFSRSVCEIMHFTRSERRLFSVYKMFEMTGLFSRNKR